MSYQLPSDLTNRSVAVLGAGVLGRRIAATWVAASFQVYVFDPSERAQQDAIAYVNENLATYLALSRRKQGSIEATSDLPTAVKNAWLVIEAVPEKLELKEDTFALLEKHAPSDCILATNSSSYKSGELLRRVKGETKERVLNMHYMMPPQALIVELMTSGHTAPSIFGFIEKEVRGTGLHPVTARVESTGFIFNRIWAAVKREVLSVLAEGVADPATIDAIWREMYGSPSGPCTMMDSVGLDTVEHIETHYVKERGLPSTALKWLHENFISKGKLGNKAESGGLYPPAKPSHGTRLLVLNMYQGSYPGQLSGVEAITSGQIVQFQVETPDIRPVTLVNNQKLPDGIDVHGDRMYWTSMGWPTSNDGAVYSAKLDGSDVQTVIPPGEVHTPKQLHIDPDAKKLYFSNREGMRVHRCNLDGSAHEILVQVADWEQEPDKAKDARNWPVGIAHSTKLEKIFWTQKGAAKGLEGRIFSASLDIPTGETAANRTDIEIIAEGLPEPIDLEFDDEAGVLYWTDRGEIPLGNTLNKKTLVGTTPQEEQAIGRQIIAQGFGEAIGLRIDPQRNVIYVADLAGRLWECQKTPAAKKKLYEASGHAYTGLAMVKY